MSIFDPLAKKKAAIDAARARKEAANSQNSKPEDAALTRMNSLIKAEDAPERIRIVVDNSGSMAYHLTLANGVSSTKMEEAKKGIVEFLRNCVPNKDAVAVHLLNLPYQANFEDYASDEDNQLTQFKMPDIIMNAVLTTDLVLLASNVDIPAIRPTGGTPLYEKIYDTLEAEPKLSRMVAFSDGQPNSTAKEGVAISLAKRYKVPIDTVFFGASSELGATYMKRLAEETGGIYIAFDPAKGVDFATAFKYLSPGKRLMLMDKSFKEKLERGEVK